LVPQYLVLVDLVLARDHTRRLADGNLALDGRALRVLVDDAAAGAAHAQWSDGGGHPHRPPVVRARDARRRPSGVQRGSRSWSSLSRGARSVRRARLLKPTTLRPGVMLLMRRAASRAPFRV